MFRTISRSCLYLVLPVMTGCAQMTTSDADRAELRSAADAADTAYLACLDAQAGRYVGTSNDASSIVTIARKNCTGTRDAARTAHTNLLTTNYILAGREVDATLAAVDARGEAAITEQVLNRQAEAPVPNSSSGSYLDCMREQASRWATVGEPASVIADAAHGRCAGQLAGVAGGAELESRGRAIVAGIVLDRKAQLPATAP